MRKPETPEEKLAAKVAALLAMLGSDNAGEHENARKLLNDLLSRHRKSWNAVPELLRIASTLDDRGVQDDPDDERSRAAASSSASSGAQVNALDLVHRMLELYVWMEPRELVAAALWILHTHVFDRFMCSPRLALTSPVRGCGKTTVLDLAERLVPRARKTDNITPAAIYHLVDREHCSLLVDEADNLGLRLNGPLRAVLNSGHRKGGSVTRVIAGAARKFSTFSPMAIAAIGALPLPISHRSITIHMMRYGGSEPLRRFDVNDTADLDAVYQQICMWARKVKLNSDPAMPSELRNRQADNWRPLVSVADSFGPYWGKAARDTAITFSKGYRDEDIAVVLLADIRDQFNARGVDRFASADLVAALTSMDDGPWAEWRGAREDQHPRKFSQGELAKLLSPFGIKSKSIWPRRRHDAGVSSSKGYTREQFEAAWRSYLDEAGTAAQPQDITHLRAL